MSLFARTVERLQLQFGSPDPEKRLSPDAKVSLLVHFCFQIGASMSSVFLNLYLWRLTESLFINGMYYIILYALSPLFFAVAGKIAKMRDRMVVYRIGIAMYAVFFLLVVLTQERVADYYMLFAVMHSISGAFYWTAYLTLMYDVSNDRNRIRYLGFNSIAFMSATLTGPVIAAFLFSQIGGLQGYVVVFGIAFVMYALTAALSFRIRTESNAHKSYYLHLMPLLLRKNRDWLRCLTAFFLLGLLQGIMLFVPNILLFLVVPREDAVGYLGMLFSAAAITVSYLLTRVAREERARTYVYRAAIGYTAGSALLLFDLSVATVIGFMLIHSLCNPLHGNTLTSYMYRMIGQLPLQGQLRIESMVMRETFLNAGRVVSITMLIVLASDLAGSMLAWVLIGGSLMQFGVVWMIRKNGAGVS
ncbi:MFS transporter [Paenibacillus koleovorans]|uniref:MFS transporter n=1 Tax=Paenibacillus koleovorans TaxID=121608 RepID=UPI000FDA4AF0|nr:MFS transporter [Paenibacillus koleovorans]